MMIKKLDWKYIGLVIFFFALLISTKVYSDLIMKNIKSFFEIEYLNLFAGGISTVFMFTHKIKTQKLKFNSTMSFHEFRIPFEDILSFIGNPITLICSISLAKGLFMQTSEDIQYFPFFQSIELSFIGAVTAYLIYISVMELVVNIKETILLNNTKAVHPKASNKVDNDKVIPNPN